MAMLVLPAMLFPGVPGRVAIAAAPVAADESAVSTGSWFCSRYAQAAAAGGGPAADVMSAVRSFARGYVYGVSDAVGKPFPETAGNGRRITELMGSSCSQDPARAVRDASLLAGRAMLEDARSAEGNSAPDATGMLACSFYLDASGNAQATARMRSEVRAEVHEWADGYIHARFERAGRGLIPTARNKALMLDRFAAACAANPTATVREAARSVAGATILPR